MIMFRSGLPLLPRIRRRISIWIPSLAGLLVLSGLIGISVTSAYAQYYNQRAPAFQGPGAFDMLPSRFATILIGAVVGFLTGAFWSPAARQFRRLLLLIAFVIAVLFALFGPVPIGDSLSDVVAFIAAIVAFVFGIRLGAKALAELMASRGRPTSFGSAKWATFEHLLEHGMIGSRGFRLGTFAQGEVRHPLSYIGDRHLLTVAPTRSGKGVSAIIPNLLTYEGSAFVVDPKGENALITATRRGEGDPARGITGLGQDVYLVDPWDIAATRLGSKPARFNPLIWITADDPDAAENAMLLADALVPEENRGGGESRFWDDESKALLAGLILYVATAPEEEGQRHLGRVRDILTSDEDKFNAVLENMLNHPNPVVSSTADRTAAKDAKLRSNVLTGAQAHTHFLDSPRIRESLSATDFNFEHLKSKKMSVYLILPADRLKTFDRWLRLLIQQAITVNARNISEKPNLPVLFLLDEMAALGKLTSVEQAYGLMAGFSMQLWGIVQDLSQLARIYGEHGWQTFISNSGVIQYLGSRDKMTAEYFSTLCGVTTVEIHNFSWAVGKAIGWSRSSSSGQGSSNSTSSSETDNWTRTTGINESQRKLAFPDELMVMKRDEQIVFIENLDPVPARKVRWFEDESLARHGVNLGNSELPPTSVLPAYVPPLPFKTPASNEALAVGMQAVDTLRPAAEAAVSFLRGLSAKLPRPPDVPPLAAPMPAVPSPVDTEDRAPLVDVVREGPTAPSPAPALVAPAQPPPYAPPPVIFAPAEPRPAPVSPTKQADVPPTGGQRPNGWLVERIKTSLSRR
jgi:type IV secretion system protein VirD4